MPFTAHCLAFFALVSTEQEPAPVEAPRFVLTIVDDLGQPLGDIPVQLGMSQTSPGRSQWHALGGVPRRTDAGGRLALELRRAWTPGATLAVNLREARVAGDHYRDPEVPWDGGAGACTLVVPRPG